MNLTTARASRPRRAVATVMVAVALMAVPANTARAESKVFTDDRHDVAYVNRYDPSITSPAPTTALGDLTKFKVSYSQHRVTAVARFRELNHRGRWFAVDIMYEYAVRGSVEYVQAVVLVRHRHPRGEVVRPGDQARCRFTHHVSYRRDSIRLSLPAKCLGYPRWLRPSIHADSWFKGSDDYYGFDVMPWQHGDIVRFGQRLHRG